ncbi:hypothetical protein [Cognatiyoonia sp. IB215182]|uniref:hypothetical protein n=1 Tax=Cognatiyoonia sp. IB215182 TaxID=3097353 RepID=UPI002A11CAAD|nr:hypothetical protein [Cognatiyoonia sp. IB215182]MDX8351479.1 hypothetical protein [Cognatiyoonia sp. IB215182]
MDIIKTKIAALYDSEEGAVTLDFVVLVATIVLLGLAVVGAFDDETLDLANNIASNIASVQIAP